MSLEIPEVLLAYEGQGGHWNIDNYLWDPVCALGAGRLAGNKQVSVNTSSALRPRPVSTASFLPPRASRCALFCVGSTVH